MAEEDSPDLPYRAEYAKSGRAGCRGCKSTIEKGSLRLACMVQSPMFDGKMPMWYHFMCFFGKQKPKSVGDIAHFEELKFEDQEKLRKLIAEKGGGGGASTSATNGDVPSKAKKRTKTDIKKGLKNEFLIEYSKSSRAACRGCEEKIAKTEIRLSKKDFDSDEGRRYGGIDRWYHMSCFVKMRSELGFVHCGDVLPGFASLSKEDKEEVKKALPEITPKTEGADAVDGEVPAKKIKVEKKPSKEEKKEKEKLKKQSDALFKAKDMIKDLAKPVLWQLLEYNNQALPVGLDRSVERLADVMTFGKLLPCEKCSTGQYVFRSGVGYQCTGSLSEWVKCENINVKPPRAPFKVPESIIEEYEQFGSYKCKVSDRIIQFNERSDQSIPSTSDSQEGGPKVKLDRKLPFKGMDFFIYKLGKEKNALKIEIEKLGGRVSSILHTEVAAVISTEGEVENCTDKMEEIKELDIQVVSKDFIEKCKNLDDAVDKIVEYSISPWGGDPKKRVDKSRQAKSELKSMKSGKSKFEKSGQSSKVKYKVQSGTAVEPESGLVDVAHVYRDRSDLYTVVLGLTDIQTQRNSFYKLQLLESDSKKNKPSYWLFRAWGRIGTTIGGTKLDKFNSNLEKAKTQFKFYYLDKTGNTWENHKNFKKIPGKMYPLNVDYGGSETKDKRVEALDASNSKLKKPVQDLIMMIFDIDLMKKTMIEFEINLDEMPLGRISKSQMLLAYSVLTELQSFINEKGEDIKPNQRALIIEATNRFYTLVPHNFGIKDPPILDNVDIIKTKIEMLDSLLEMEFAYEVMQSNQESGEHSLDSHYAKLNADIDVLEHDCKEFEIIKDYVKNTHAETHSNYELEILDVFKVVKKEEEKRFKPFKKLPNRKLLWHGSRLTNFAGILSQGLRIAPPEAPATGYMFGKGIYFADMVSKSANYCMTSPNNNIGLLMLCEVALGSMYERSRADYIEKLPKGYHSCKGVGVTSPNPKESITLEDGLEVPIGKPLKNANQSTALLYNEYIVYDVAQVKAKYLLKMNFKYKY